MKIKKGNLFTPPPGTDAICITTNGTIKQSGACVMGRGVALTAKKKWKGIDFILGRMIRVKGNIVNVLGGTLDKYKIVSFPVKHNWYEKADIKLIKTSATQLVELANKMNWNSVYLPVAGCGNGKLSWADVRPVLSDILDDRFTVVYFSETESSDDDEDGIMGMLDDAVAML